jgi:hypothetical protein
MWLLEDTVSLMFIQSLNVRSRWYLMWVQVVNELEAHPTDEEWKTYRHR